MNTLSFSSLTISMITSIMIRGIRPDPFNSFHIATFTDAALECIRIWDLRKMQIAKGKYEPISVPFYIADENRLPVHLSQPLWTCIHKLHYHLHSSIARDQLPMMFQQQCWTCSGRPIANLYSRLLLSTPQGFAAKSLFIGTLIRRFHLRFSC